MRSRWTRALIGLFVTAVMVPLAAPVPVSADQPGVPHPQLPHNPLQPEAGADFYHPYVWPEGTRQIEVVFTTDVPQGPFRERVADSLAEWQSLGAVEFTVADRDTEPRSPWGRCDTSPDGTITIHHMRRDAGPFQGPLASAQLCRQAAPDGAWTHIRAANVIFDAEELWYTGESDLGTLPEGTHDLEGTAVHEIGHALGFWRHFDLHVLVDIVVWPFVDTECVPTELTYHTMCEWGPTGVTWTRTLEWHEEQLHLEAYGLS